MTAPGDGDARGGGGGGAARGGGGAGVSGRLAWRLRGRPVIMAGTFIPLALRLPLIIPTRPGLRRR